ncbi:MAG: Gldg family protein [Planctomycetota bacterium]
MTRIASYITLVLLVALFVGFNIVSSRTLGFAKIDLTENSLYTLSPAGRSIARTPDEPITLTLYYSESVAQGQPQIQSAADRVIQLLEAFEDASNGKIVLRRIDPEPFSEAEDDAVTAGIQGVRITQTDTFYFGLVGTNALDGREVIPYVNALDPSNERFLEYEFAKLILTLAEEDKPVVGLITSLPVDGTPPNPMARTRGTPEWQILPEIRTTLDLRRLETTVTEIPEDIDVLMLAHAKGLTDATLYAIDQFALKGGRVLAFIDPHAESDPAGRPDPQNPFAAGNADTSSTLGPLMGAWGVEMPTDQIAGDLKFALEVGVQGPGGRPEAVPYVAYLSLRDEAFDANSPITGRLGTVNLASAGFLTPAENATTVFEPIVTTSIEAAPVTSQRVKLFPDPRGILNDFFPQDEPLTIAARLTGPVQSAFPDGPPAGVDDAAQSGEEGTGEGETEQTHLTESTGGINVVIVADADVLADTFWIQAMNLGGITLGYQRVADNGALVAGLLDQLAGSTDLVSLRARGEYRRPFTLIEEMQRRADAEFRAEEQRLEQQIEQTQERINSLQLARGDDPSSLVLSPEQQAEVDRLQDELIASRKQLRQVQLNLREDIERLETRLQLINTAAVPVLLSLFAFSLAVARGIRRRVDRRKGADR